MSDVLVREPRIDDLPELVGIYNHFVRETHHTFDLHEVSVDERQGWLQRFSPAGRHRLWVAEIATGVVGYATSGPLRPKPAYDTSVETTVYVNADFTGRGIGSQLYTRLLNGLTQHPDLHRAYAVIALPNPGCVAFHERFGFECVGAFHEVGLKFGQRWDVAWYEKDLSGISR